MTELCSGFNAGIAFHSHYPREAPSGRDGAASFALGATQLISGVCIRNATATETAASTPSPTHWPIFQVMHMHNAVTSAYDLRTLTPTATPLAVLLSLSVFWLARLLSQAYRL